MESVNVNTYTKAVLHSQNKVFPYIFALKTIVWVFKNSFHYTHYTLWSNDQQVFRRHYRMVGNLSIRILITICLGDRMDLHIYK